MLDGSVLAPAAAESAELQQLERLAAYCLGSFDSGANRFQQGLNVVLKVLGVAKDNVREIGELASEPSAHRNRPHEICLPITQSEFLESIREENSL